MYYFRDITKSYSDRNLLDQISFMIGKKERIGLVGRNGAGKSTLLKIIANELSADGGKVEIPSGTSIGYLKQELNYNKGVTVMEEALSCHKEVNNIKEELDHVSDELTHRTDYTTESYSELTQRLSDLTMKLTMLEEGSLEANASRILKGLGFSEDDLIKDINTFSGGWQMRVELAKLLLTTPDILLLDEPNNHLDIESIIWLENYLKDYAGIVILISHDTMFLNNICERILEIELGKLNDFRGNYYKYVEEKEKMKDILESSYINQQKAIAEKERTITRFMAKATKTKMAQSMQKQLDKVERIEIPDEDTSMLNIQFAAPPRSGRDVLDVVKTSKSYGPKRVLVDVNLKLERGDRIAFVGQNGQGKSTLAKIITGNVTKDKGDIKLGTNVNIGYYAQNQTEIMDPSYTVLEVAEDAAPPSMRTKVRSVLGSFLFSGENVDKKVSVLSGGERARLALACLVMSPNNFLIFDEPTNHLDIQAKFILQESLKKFEGTLLVVSHDREFLRGLTDKVIEFKDHKLKEYLGDIDYFLQKRAMDNMRSVELDKQAEEEKQPQEEKSKLSFEEQKQLKRKVQSVEREIEKLEAEIKKQGEKLMDPDFYKSDDFISFNEAYQNNKNQLAIKEDEWSELVENGLD
jgi:ATP-binding cassette subfamily F protein 3